MRQLFYCSGYRWNAPPLRLAVCEMCLVFLLHRVPSCGIDLLAETEPGAAAFPIPDFFAATASPVHTRTTTTYTRAWRIRGTTSTETQVFKGSTCPRVSNYGRRKGKGTKSKINVTSIQMKSSSLIIISLQTLTSVLTRGTCVWLYFKVFSGIWLPVGVTVFKHIQ